MIYTFKSKAAGDLMLSYAMKHAAWWFAAVGVGCTGVAYAVFLGMLRKLPCSVVVPTQAGNCIVTVVAKFGKMLHIPDLSKLKMPSASSSSEVASAPPGA